MNRIFQFTGILTGMMYAYIPVYGLCIIIIALLDKLLFSFMGSRYYKTIKIYPVLEPLVKTNNQKYSGDPVKKTEELAKLLASNHYPLFGGIGNLVTEAILSVGLIGVFSKPQLYLNNSAVPEKMNFLFFNLRSSPLSLLNNSAPGNTSIIFSLILVMLTLATIIVHDKIMEARAFIDQSYNKIIWVLFTVCFIIFNHAFTLYWFYIKVMDFIHMYICSRFYRVSLAGRRNYGRQKIIKRNYTNS